MHPKLTETLSKYNKIILVGGGTGGHIQPIVSLIQGLHPTIPPSDHPTIFLWIGGKNSNESQEAKKNNIEFRSISTLKLSTTKSPKVLLYPFVLFQGILEARKILGSVIANKVKQSSQKKDTAGSLRTPGGPLSSFHSDSPFPSLGQKSNLRTYEPTNLPVAVFSKGGPGSVAVGIAAWILGIPLYIHESDTIPGRSNRLLGKIATKVFLGFERAKQYFNPEKCEIIGQILHPVFSSHCEPAKQSRKAEIQKPLARFVPRDDRSMANWRTNKPHLLVICASQGARVVFEEILANLEEILKENELILVLGKLNTDMRKDFEEKLNTRFLHLPADRHGTQEGQKSTIGPSNYPTIQLFDWLSQEDIARLIPDTDIAITRGSATTLAELTAFSSSHLRTYEPTNLPRPRLIIIPLPYSADNHQYYNAKEYEKLGHILLEQKNLNLLTQTLENIGQSSPPSNI